MIVKIDRSNTARLWMLVMVLFAAFLCADFVMS